MYLRIVVDSGGCNGFLAKFELDDKPFAKDDMYAIRSQLPDLIHFLSKNTFLTQIST